mgnify:CR=1 FL=1
MPNFSSENVGRSPSGCAACGTTVSRWGLTNAEAPSRARPGAEVPAVAEAAFARLNAPAARTATARCCAAVASSAPVVGRELEVVHARGAGADLLAEGGELLEDALRAAPPAGGHIARRGRTPKGRRTNAADVG